MKYWWNRYQTRGNVNSEINNSAHHRKLTEDQQRDIVRRLKRDPFLTAISFAREFQVSRFAIRSVIKKNGLKCRTAARQSRLTEEHKINRLAFCATLLEWEDHKLNSIIFSDEKTFCSDVKWRSKVYRPRNKRYHEKYVKTERLSGRITACYWGAISINGPITNLVKINGPFNSNKYKNIIIHHLNPIMRNTQNIFMQDNSPVHTATQVMEYLTRQPYETMDWPPLSPDLNPIENVWSIMMRDWPLMENRNQESLDELVQRRWNNLRNNPGISEKKLKKKTKMN